VPPSNDTVPTKAASFVQPRPCVLSASLIIGTIAAGLTLRLVPLGLPYVVVKYGGSMLWALMIYWMVSSIRGRWSLIRGALVAGAVALSVELFKLYSPPWLDAFRLTLPGTLLLGRLFAVWNLIAYAFAIGIGMFADRAIRSRP
jgi:Protein of unknown function (DUF2809)